MADGVLELRVAWERHIGSGAVAGAALEAVIARYREAHRHYHSVRHLVWVVRHVGDLGDRHEVGDLGAVAAAAFYHDVVYDPRASDNEAVSAGVARAALDELGWAPDRFEAVAAMIIGTASHDLTAPDTDVDAAVLYAADLAVLAAEPAKYGDYVRNVRREYAHVDEPAWIVGRSAVLQSFLGRPAIYAPALGLDDWEARARANIAAELGDLTRD